MMGREIREGEAVIELKAPLKLTKLNRFNFMTTNLQHFIFTKENCVFQINTLANI